MNGDRVLRIIATLTLWLAPLPAAFFVGRSVYWHLIFNWHLSLGGIGIVAAVITGGMIELVGILSAHTALACWRWNHHGNVKKAKSPWERAPFALAVTCFLVYAAVAITLAVVLEALPFLAVYAPALVTAMAATAYVSLGVYEQQRDRLARYNLSWNWKAKPSDDSEATSEPERIQVADAADMVLCDVADCNRVFAWPSDYSNQRSAQNALNAHRRWHHTNNGRKPEEVERERGRTPRTG